MKPVFSQVVGDQSTTQPMTMQAVQPQQVVQQQPPQAVQYEGSPIGTNEDNSALKTETQGATLQDAGATQTQLVESPAGSLGTGSESIQNFAQPDSGKDMDEMKDLQVYNGPLPESAQNKPRINGVSPQEDIKVVNLGDDEKTANLQGGGTLDLRLENAFNVCVCEYFTPSSSHSLGDTMVRASAFHFCMTWYDWSSMPAFCQCANLPFARAPMRVQCFPEVLPERLLP